MSLLATRKNPISRLSLVAKAYHLRMASPCFDSHKKRIDGKWDLKYNKFAKKMVIISCNATDGVNLCYARVSDLSIVAHLSWGRMKGRLALLRLGGGGCTENWEWDTDFCTQVFQDILTYRGRLCTLDPQGAVFVMDYKSLKMTQIASPSSMPCNLQDKELGESFGDLYLDDAPGKRPGDANMYKLQGPCKEWVKVESIADPITAKLAFHALLPSF